jgi:hypothetical protein
VAGVGKSVLASYIADQISSQHPGAQVTTVTGALTVEELVSILVADRPSLVVLDQFEQNVTDGAIADRGLAAVLVCLAEEIAGREDLRRYARIIVTARQPLRLSPRILVRQVGPLTRWSADAFACSLPRLGRLTGAEREYAWRLTAGNPGSLRALDARLAEATFAELADNLAGVIAAKTGQPTTPVFPNGLDPATAAAIASAAESVLSQPRVVLRADAASRRRPRRPRLRALSAALITAVIAWAPFAVRSLMTAFAPAPITVHASGGQGSRTGQASRTGHHVESTTATTPAVQDAAATWIAGNVSSGTLIGCDPAMCTSLSHLGLPPNVLSPLRPGSDLSADGLIVATPLARTLMGSAIQAAAPELAASFGTGGGQVDVWQVTPGGAAAYSSRLADDIASRREGGNLILGNASVKASGDNWMVLCSGHVDSRILLALAEIAHSAPLTIASFGAASPGAAPEVPLRSVLIEVADPAAAAASLKVQDPAMQPLAVRMGHASLWVEFGAPSPIGLFQANP